MELVNRTCLLRLMETCREFYTAGAILLLRQRIRIRDEAAFKSFRSLVFATTLGIRSPPTSAQQSYQTHLMRLMTESSTSLHVATLQRLMAGLSFYQRNN